MKQKPYGQRIIVKEVTKEIKTLGGLSLDNSNTPIGTTAEIVAVGNQVNHPCCVVGNQVVFPTRAGVEAYIDGVKYLTLLEPEVWWFIEKEVQERDSNI